MKLPVVIISLLVVLYQPPAIAADAYVNGRWYDGSGFIERDVYVSDGRISFAAPDRISNTYDLGGGYVIPPFAEAHNHDLTTDFAPEERIKEYLQDGVFYTKMQSAFSKEFARLEPHFNTPNSVDATFAFAPVTGPGGHPIRIRESFFERGYYEGIFQSKDQSPGIGYTEVGSHEDLLDKFPNLVRQNPDFIKVMLSYSEEYELRRDDPEFFGYKGLDARLLPSLVSMAHAEGLRVSAHIDTAADFHYAVIAGVDEIAHLPGADAIEVVRSDDAKLAAEKGIGVITTISLTKKIQVEMPGLYKKVMAQHARNLTRLKQAGVRILIGSDLPYRDTSVGEAFLLRELDVFSDGEILRMWCETTPRSIFSGRAIGRLDDGFEASFLVLEGNPIEDRSYVRRIALRVKQGSRLND